MPRIRSVHPAICDDEALARVSPSAERTFVRLWTQLDDDGRHEDRPKLLAARLYPEHDDMGPSEVDDDLEELTREGLLIRYEVDGQRLLSAKPDRWPEWQKPKHYKASALPPPPAEPEPDPAGPGSETSVLPATPEGTRNGTGHPPVVGVEVGEGEEDPGPDAPPPKRRRRTSEQADTITREFWEQSDPKPMLNGGYVALRQIVDKALKAGWTGPEILAALQRCKTFTSAWLEGQLRELRADQPRTVYR